MRIFDRLLRPFLVLSVLLIFLEVVVEVASRFIFHNPLPWGAEVSQTHRCFEEGIFKRKS